MTRKDGENRFFGGLLVIKKDPLFLGAGLCEINLIEEELQFFPAA